MGADINLAIETRSPSGAWRLTESASGSTEDWYELRTYECFSLLTGLEFSKRKIRPLIPVAEMRGWPVDAAPETVDLFASWGDDAYGQSWLTSRDFDNYDWDQRVEWSYMASPPRGHTVSKRERAKVEAYVRTNGRPPERWMVSAWSRDGFPVVGALRRRDLASEFIVKIVEPMRSLAGHDPDSARCIFNFMR